MPIDDGPSKHQRAVISRGNAQMRAVPGAERLGITRLQENSPHAYSFPHRLIAPVSFTLLNQFIQLGFVLGLAAGLWAIFKYPCRLGLSHALARVGLDRLGC